MAPNLRIEDIKPISNFVLLAVQVDGYCQAMTTALQLNQPVGTVAMELLRKFLDEAKRVGEGGAFQKWPDLPGGVAAADLFAVAMVLRSTLWAFLDQASRESVVAASQPWGLAEIREHRNARPDTLAQRNGEQG